MCHICVAVCQGVERELEAIIFIAGVTFSSPASSVPIPVIAGLIAGALVGYILYR
jgi:high-affinity iron transporter